MMGVNYILDVLKIYAKRYQMYLQKMKNFCPKNYNTKTAFFKLNCYKNASQHYNKNV